MRALSACFDLLVADLKASRHVSPRRSWWWGKTFRNFKTYEVATALDMKGSWKENPDLVFSVVREAAEAWATVEQADKLSYVRSRAKGAVARVGSAKEEKQLE